MKRLQPTTKYKIDPDTDIIELVRLGSHSELFNK